VVQALLTEGSMPMIRNSNVVKIILCVCFWGLFIPGAWAQDERASPSFPSIKPQELKKMIDSKAADILVVSNDPQESYEEGHIPGAISYPWVSTLKAPVSLPRNKTLVLYCSCAHEEDSSDMAAKLAMFGYHNVKLLEGGFLKWSALKYPIETKK
jgi:3-mercaptopyruvate sulfurtransferase SseA